jgi:1,4-dihydroxy-2-naphthoyl-CoA hydrolase
MPVDKRTHQPFGIIHGGANCVLAETLGSFGSNLIVDSEKFHGVGLNISTNHIKAVRRGLVTGVATITHKGKSTHTWNIKTYNDAGDLTSESIFSVMIISKLLS